MEGRSSGRLAVVNCEYVLVDYDVVLKAPERLNTAGLGDVLCGYAGISEWRRSAELGKTGPVDEAKTANAIALYDQIVTDFPQTLDADGELTPASVKVIMNAVQARDDALVQDERAPRRRSCILFCSRDRGGQVLDPRRDVRARRSNHRLADAAKPGDIGRLARLVQSAMASRRCRNHTRRAWSRHRSLAEMDG